MKKPNFLFIGPDKSGSTWIYNVLKFHRQVCMSPAKEIFYFDYYYHKGPQWYLENFSDASEHHKVVGEVSHDYLFSQAACRRIYRDLKSVRLMVCLRDPVKRAFSSYLFMVRQGRATGSFSDEVESQKELIEHGFYAKHLKTYIKTFGRANIHIGMFDEIKNAPDIFASKLFTFLGIENLSLPEHLKSVVLPAARPRSFILAKLAKYIACQVRNAGYPVIVNKIKNINQINQILYSPYNSENKPKPRPETVEYLKNVFEEDVYELERLTGDDFAKRWGF